MRAWRTEQVTHSTFALGLARILDMVFWVYSYQELTSHAGSHSVGMFVLIAQFVHILIMGDFFYYYAIRSDREEEEKRERGA